jgi:hypothetical protein
MGHIKLYNFSERKIDYKIIEEENIIHKIQAINYLEKIDPYPHYLASDSYWNRIDRALNYIPEKYHDYAISLFANVIYISSMMLDEAWRQCFKELKRYTGYKLNEENLFSEALIIGEEHDLVKRFCYANNLFGRLDIDKIPRSGSVEGLIKDILLSLLLSNFIEEKDYRDLIKEYQDLIRSYLKRPYWILLTDYVLSGTSLVSDAKRIIKISKICNPQTKIIILAQIITSEALDKINKEVPNQIKIIYAIYLNENFKINSDDCKLFIKKDTLKMVRELCEWFATNILIKDKRYDDSRKLSGDDLRYGFKASGLTLVTPNCPSNSVPLLWYYKKEGKEGDYEGPYPRVESRITQKKGLSELFLRILYVIWNKKITFGQVLPQMINPHPKNGD